jgi:preprotein translocase subunit SecF
VASILFVGAGMLGAGTLKDLALVLFVGMLSGTYSSIFIATPVLAGLKERDPQYKDLAVKVRRRLAGGRAAQRTTAGAPGAGSGTAAPGTTAPGTAPPATAVSATGTTVTTVTMPAASDEPADTGPDDGDLDTGAETEVGSDGIAVSAARAGDPAPRPVARQQRVTGSAQRRPGARKKRR